jgi:D-cysteine desulfhydrase
MSPVELPPRIDVARLPTPVIPLDRLSARWGGPRIWLKRDDQTGSVLSGNKIRKLQFAVRDAIDQGADTLVTCGGVQSNHCRATAGVARLHGLDVVLMLRGSRPEELTGNYLLDRLFGAQIHFVTPEQYLDKESLLEAIADELNAHGRTPYVMGEGCSIPIGVWGYVEAAKEIAETERALDVRFDAYVHACGSGGTTAGLALGARLFDLPGDVLAMAVCDDVSYFRTKIHRLVSETIDRWKLGVTLAPDELHIVDDYVGRGYGMTQPDELETLATVARTEGIVLDPVYSAKAFHGLRHEIASGRLSKAKNVLFVHTGGIFGTMAYADQLPA